MLGSKTYTDPVKLDADASPRNAVTASAIQSGDLVMVKLTQRDQTIYLTRAEIAALAGMTL